MNRRRKILAGATCATVTAVALPLGAAAAAEAAAPAANSQSSTRVASGAAPAMSGARRMLETAEADLAEARRIAQTMREQARNGAVDSTLLAPQQADPDLQVGMTDVELVANLMSPADPDLTLREATINDIASVSSPAPSTPIPDEPVLITSPQHALAAAQERVAAAADERDTAAALIRQLSGQDSPDGPGAAKLAELCRKARVVVAVCEPVPWTEGHLQFDTVMIGRTVNTKWSAIEEVGGYRPYDPYPDHPSGRAADIMMPNGGAGSDAELGTEIARYFQKHAAEYGIYYILWRQRMWIAGRPLDGWTAMSDRGSPTANHMDHVHITVSTGHDGTAWRTLLREAQREAVRQN